MARDTGTSPAKYRPAVDRTGGPFDSYEVKEALRTLSDAEKIKRNRALLRACRIEAQKQVEAAKATSQSIQGVK